MQVSSFGNGDREGTSPHIRWEVSEYSTGAQAVLVIGAVPTGQSVLTYCEVNLMLPILQLGKLRLKEDSYLVQILPSGQCQGWIPARLPGPGACWWLSVPRCLNVPSVSALTF